LGEESQEKSPVSIANYAFWGYNTGMERDEIKHKVWQQRVME